MFLRSYVLTSLRSYTIMSSLCVPYVFPSTHSSSPLSTSNNTLFWPHTLLSDSDQGERERGLDSTSRQYGVWVWCIQQRQVGGKKKGIWGCGGVFIKENCTMEVMKKRYIHLSVIYIVTFEKYIQVKVKLQQKVEMYPIGGILQEK